MALRGPLSFGSHFRKKRLVYRRSVWHRRHHAEYSGDRFGEFNMTKRMPGRQFQ